MTSTVNLPRQLVPAPPTMILAPLFASLLVTSSATLPSSGDVTTSEPASRIGEPALEPFPNGYLDNDHLGQTLHRLAASSPNRIRIRSLPQAREGRDVWLVTQGPVLEANSSPRPAILVVANLEADHVVGSQVALELIRRVSAGNGRNAMVGQELTNITFYVVPWLNPDGTEHHLARPAVELRTNNLGPIDRDGRQGEDGPEDANGDS